jgi:glyoxylase-like metal-dependent hydrolase (beta-lactamase superfamily II)
MPSAASPAARPPTEGCVTPTTVRRASRVREYVAEGATIITHESNKAYYQKVWANPHTISPDRISQSPRSAKFKLVSERLTLTDGSRVVELYHLQHFGHNDGAIVAYLPKEKVLVEADAFNPPAAPITQTPTVINPSTQSRDANIERLHLDVQRIIPIHLPADNRQVTLAELHKAIGKSWSQRSNAAATIMVRMQQSGCAEQRNTVVLQPFSHSKIV